MAKTADAKFSKYYDSFIPGIKAIVTAAAPKAGTDPQVCWLAHERDVKLKQLVPSFAGICSSLSDCQVSYGTSSCNLDCFISFC